MGIDRVAACAARAAGDAPGGRDHVDLPLRQVGGQGRQAFNAPLGPAIFDRDIAPLDEPGFAQSLLESGQPTGERLCRLNAEKADDRYLRLLRARRVGPRRASRQSAKARDELAALDHVRGHSITSSASTSM